MSTNAYEVSGSVTSDGDFSATVGSVSTGAVFEGYLSENTGSGTWTNLAEGWTGTWEVSKE